MQVTRAIQNAVCLIAMSASAAALAETVPTFDTMGPGNSFITDTGWGVGGGPNSNANYFSLMKFNAQVDGTLASAVIAIARDQCCLAGSAEISLRLLSDNGGVPGQVLASTSALSPETYQLTSASFAQGVEITRGTTYWFGVASSDATSSHTWFTGGLVVPGVMAFTGASWQNPGDWFYNVGYPLGAFRVNVTSPVDEPPVALLLALGTAALYVRQRQRQAPRIRMAPSDPVRT